MGILDKKKKKPPIEIPQSVRKGVEDDLLQHFSQYEFFRKGSEIALSMVLLDSLLRSSDVAIDESSITTSIANDKIEVVTHYLTKLCIDYAEMLDGDNALEPLLDEYFSKYGNFRR